MNGCLDADALLAIGHALDWNVEERLSHLRTCADCRAQLETLQRVRDALQASTPVDPDAVRRITAALREAGSEERHRARQRSGLRQIAEACAAGVTAVLVIVSNGISIESPATAVAGFLLGALLIMTGTALANRLPTFGAHVANG
jgi:hypothetical protein